MRVCVSMHVCGDVYDFLRMCVYIAHLPQPINQQSVTMQPQPPKTSLKKFNYNPK